MYLEQLPKSHSSLSPLVPLKTRKKTVTEKRKIHSLNHYFLLPSFSFLFLCFSFFKNNSKKEELCLNAFERWKKKKQTNVILGQLDSLIVALVDFSSFSLFVFLCFCVFVFL